LVMSDPVPSSAPKARTARAASQQPTYTIDLDSDEESEASEFEEDDESD